MSIGKGLVVIGTQFGDEGKGKITDFYASKPWIHAVVRFNGGSNAGHTIITPDGTKYALHLLPSGMVYEKPSFIGNGVVINFEKIQEELKHLEKKKGNNLQHLLKISNRAHIVLPHHIALDEYQEELKLKYSSFIGTTKQGIGPAYHDKISRIGIRVGDLWDEERLNTQLDYLTHYYKPLSSFLPKLKEIKTVKKELLQFKNEFSSNVIDVGHELYNRLHAGENILFEGAQATLLDIDHGLYPFGTSSTCIAAGASSGTGPGVQYLNERIGVVKAFVSRVGSGPLMGELDTTINHGKMIQTTGKEFGTTTGRPRRIAWLDLVSLKYACRINGLTGLAITKLDIIGLLETIQVITAYRDRRGDNTELANWPAIISDFDNYDPVTKDFSGWGHFPNKKWEQMCVKGWKSFPSALKQYVDFIEQETQTPVVLIGVGAGRNATFERKDLSANFIT